MIAPQGILQLTHTVKLLKIRTPKKNLNHVIDHRIMCPKNAEGVTNIADPDQTAV